MLQALLSNKRINTVSIKSKLSQLTKMVVISTLAIQGVGIVAVQQASAAPLTTTYIRLNRMKSGQTTSVRLVFKATTNQTAQIAIDFNGTDLTTARWTDGANAGVVNATQTFNTATCASETGHTALPGISGVSGSGSTVTTAGVTALTAGTTYCVDLTSATAVTTPTTAGEYHPTVTHNADVANVAVRVIANDQIVVTATVQPTFNFVLSGNTDAFTTPLSTSSVVSTSGRTVTITSNAASGWVAWVKNLNGSSGAATKGALLSATASNFTIPTTNANALGSASHALTTNTQDYGLSVDITTDFAGGGTVALDAAYSGVGTEIGVLDPTNYRPIATANGTAGGDVITLTERATIDGLVPAATDYTDTITVIGAGNF